VNGFIAVVMHCAYGNKTYQFDRGGGNIPYLSKPLLLNLLVIKIIWGAVATCECLCFKIIVY
jgi:hypothetical protein